MTASRAVAQEADSLNAARVTADLRVAPPAAAIAGPRLRSAVNLPAAIREFSGIQLRDYGGAGGLKTINVRSLGSAHTAIFLDGLPIDNAQNTQVDLGRISTEGLERVELFQGQRAQTLQTAREYGSASSLHLTSALPSPEGRNGFRVRLRGGSFGTISPSAAWESRWTPVLSSRVQAGFTHAHGRYPFHVKDFRDTPEGYKGYDTVMVRQNCDLTEFRADAQLFYTPEGGRYNIRVSGYDADRGIPGPVYKQAERYPLSNDRQSDRSLSIQAGGEQELTENLSLLARAKYARDRLKYLDISELDPSVSAIWDYLLQSGYLSTGLSWKASEQWYFGGAVDGQYETLQSRVSAQRKTLFAAISTCFLEGPWRASASAQFQHSRGAGTYDFLSPSFLLEWTPDRYWEFGALLKRSCRLPSFNDLYYSQVTVRKLQPEQVYQAAAHWSWNRRYPHWYFQAREELYFNYVKDKLIAVPNGSLFRWSMYNLGGVRILGDEINASANWYSGPWTVGGTARYTYQWARDTETGGQIPYIPLHSANFRIFTQWGGWSVDLQGFVTGERFSSSTNRRDFRVAPWTTWDASVAYAFPESGLSLRLQLNNLLNENYEIIRQYPMPGFNVFGTLEYVF
ncbi:MAG: TonB-dependent receptor [Bacteroidales bacterium]|nr:TonB-dependent receptor [Bacteroidales bacterium]